MRAQVALLGVALFVGHPGPPLEGLHDASGPRPAGGAPAESSTASVDALRFLDAARGAAPVICSLAAAPLGEGWGYAAPPAEASAAQSGLLEWALKPSIGDRDLIVLDEGLRDDDPCVRTMAARLLGAAGMAGARTLIEALSDEQPEIRRAAAEGLGRGEEGGTTALIERLHDADAGVRATAAWALGRREAPEAADVLVEALADPVAMVRLAAIEALGEIELEESIEPLLPMLDSDDLRIRAAAGRAVGRIL